MNVEKVETVSRLCERVEGEAMKAARFKGKNGTNVSEGWVKADVSFTLKKWVEDLRLNRAIQIACSTCSIDRYNAPVSVEQTLKPFLVMHTSPLPQKNRPKRNSNCLPEMKECCRDELYINFDDIGWSDWILHPSGYHAYFCRGSCSSAASLTISGSPYNNVIRVGIFLLLSSKIYRTIRPLIFPPFLSSRFSEVVE